MGFDFALELARVGECVAVEFFADGVEDFFGSADAEVGGQQGVLELLEERGVDLALTEKDRIDGLGKCGFGLADRSFELFEKCGFRLVFAEK